MSWLHGCKPLHGYDIGVLALPKLKKRNSPEGLFPHIHTPTEAGMSSIRAIT